MDLPTRALAFEAVLEYTFLFILKEFVNIVQIKKKLATKGSKAHEADLKNLKNCFLTKTKKKKKKKEKEKEKRSSIKNPCLVW